MLWLPGASFPGPMARKTRCGSVSPAGKWAPCNHWSLKFSITSDHHPQASVPPRAPGSVGRPSAWWQHQMEPLRIISSSQYILYVLDTAPSNPRIPFLFILKTAHVRMRSWGPAPGLPLRDTPLGMSPCWQHQAQAQVTPSLPLTPGPTASNPWASDRAAGRQVAGWIPAV